MPAFLIFLVGEELFKRDFPSVFSQEAHVGWVKEGFGLTVCEALFKETPVVASNVGGIPFQISMG